MLAIETIDDPLQMIHAAIAWMTRDEANHTVAINALNQVAAHATRGWAIGPSRPTARLVIARRDGEITALALQSQVNIFPCGDDAQALTEIARSWPDGSALRTVVGPRDAALAFAAGLPCTAREHMRLLLFELTGLPIAGDARGRFIHARLANLEVLTVWQRMFMHEARVLARDGDDPRRLIRNRIVADEVRMWLDERDEPVCYAGIVRIAPHGARIGPVYTPPTFRRRGYAQALVAHICMEERVRGGRVISLFTDTANPTSSAVYRRVGFRSLNEHVHLELTSVAREY
ncbi:MAG TPA: GNAT family N-acetyltransferase [Burkholderiaceae bacterium]|nr:GNAT family N-acetyltransferase [Burkholderiaceae bacterium]